jgi:hypothetical protein
MLAPSFGHLRSKGKNLLPNHGNEDSFFTGGDGENGEINFNVECEESNEGFPEVD